jgi:hypothetical protein
MTTLNIRQANADNAHAIAKIHVHAYRTTYAAILPQKYFDGFTVERRTVVWKQLITTKDAAEQIIVGENGQHIQAYAHYGRSRDPNAAATTGSSWPKLKAAELLRSSEMTRCAQNPNAPEHSHVCKEARRRSCRSF